MKNLISWVLKNRYWGILVIVVFSFLVTESKLLYLSVLFKIAMVNVVIACVITFSNYNEIIRRIFGVCLMHHIKYIKKVCREVKENPTAFYTKTYDKNRDMICRVHDDTEVSPICKNCPHRSTVLSMLRKSNEMNKSD